MTSFLDENVENANKAPNKSLIGPVAFVLLGFLMVFSFGFMLGRHGGKEIPREGQDQADRGKGNGNLNSKSHV